MENLLVKSGFTIFGFTVPFYGIFVALAFIMAVIVCLYFCKIRDRDGGVVLDLVIIIALCALVGARLYYVIFSGKPWSFLEILQVWNGGFAVYGGIIGGAIGIIIYCLIKHISIVEIFDMVAPSLLLGQSIGRIGCYFAGCCYGEVVTNEAMQWFPFAVQINNVWHYSTFFYESFFCLLGFIALFFVYKKVKIKGLCSGCYFIYYGIVRCIIELFRGDSLYIGNSGIRVSWLLSIFVIVLGIIWLAIYITKYVKSKNSQKETKIEKTSKDL